MENIEIILSISATALGLLITTATFLTKFITNAKAKRAAERIIKISSAVIPYIEQAEKFANYTGAEKKEYVLTKANQFAIEKGIEFNSTEVSAEIEELVALTKRVNGRDKDKYAQTDASAQPYPAA